MQNLLSDRNVTNADSLILRGASLKSTLHIEVVQVILGRINIISVDEGDFEEICSIILGHSGHPNSLTIKDINLIKQRKLLNEDSIYLDRKFTFPFYNLSIADNLLYLSKISSGIDLSSATLSYFKKELLSEEIVRYVPDNRINYVKLFTLLAIPRMLWFVNDFGDDILHDEIVNLLTNRINQNGTVFINIKDPVVLQNLLSRLDAMSYKIIHN